MAQLPVQTVDQIDQGFRVFDLPQENSVHLHPDVGQQLVWRLVIHGSDHLQKLESLLLVVPALAQ